MHLLIIFLYILFVFAAIVLIVVILLQEGRGGGFGEALGSHGRETFGVGSRGINTLHGGDRRGVPRQRAPDPRPEPQAIGDSRCSTAPCRPRRASSASAERARCARWRAPARARRRAESGAP